MMFNPHGIPGTQQGLLGYAMTTPYEASQRQPFQWASTGSYFGHVTNSPEFEFPHPYPRFRPPPGFPSFPQENAASPFHGQPFSHMNATPSLAHPPGFAPWTWNGSRSHPYPSVGFERYQHQERHPQAYPTTYGSLDQFQRFQTHQYSHAEAEGRFNENSNYERRPCFVNLRPQEVVQIPEGAHTSTSTLPKETETAAEKCGVSLEAEEDHDPNASLDVIKEEEGDAEKPVNDSSDSNVKRKEFLTLNELLSNELPQNEIPFGEVLSKKDALSEIKCSSIHNGQSCDDPPVLETVDKEKHSSTPGEVSDSDEEIEKRLNSRAATDAKHLDMKAVLRFKRDGVYPPGKDKANFRRQTKRYVYENDSLFYVTHTNGFNVKLKVVVERKQRIKLMRLAHDGPSTSFEASAMSSHMGHNNIASALSREYFWPGITRDVREFIRTCEPCQRVNNDKFKVVPELRPVGVPSEIMKQVGVDLMDLGKSEDGKRYAVVLIDYFSKWTEAEALEDKCAVSVARFLHRVMCRHGCFKIQINDQGREFVNKVSEELHRLSGTKQRITSAYHPQANGLVERQNQTIQKCLKKTLCEKKEKWSQCLESAVFAHRTMVHKSTKYSPFFIVYGRHPKTPWDIEMERENNDSDADDPPEANEEKVEDCEDGNDDPDFDLDLFKERVEKMMGLREALKERVSSNIKNAQKKQKDYYDLRHKTPDTWKVGDTVMVVNKRNENRQGGKMDMNKSVGYEIVEVDNMNRCTLKNIKSGLVLKTKYPSLQLVPFIVPVTEGKGNTRSDEVNENDTKRKREASFNGRGNENPDKKVPPPRDNINKENVKPENTAPNNRKPENTAPNNRKPENTAPNNGLDNTINGNENNEMQVDVKEIAWLHPFDEKQASVLEFNRVDEQWQKTTVFNADELLHLISDVKPLPPPRTHLLLLPPRIVVNVRSDGNCWFRSVSVLLFGSEDHHEVLRSAITGYMISDEEIKDKIRSYALKNPGDDYFRDWKMQESGTWATDVEIFATAAYLRTDIFVFSRGKGAYNARLRSHQRPPWCWLQFKSSTFRPKSEVKKLTVDPKCMYVFHENGNHYVPVFDIYL